MSGPVVMFHTEKVRNLPVPIGEIARISQIPCAVKYSYTDFNLCVKKGTSVPLVLGKWRKDVGIGTAGVERAYFRKRAEIAAIWSGVVPQQPPIMLAP